MLNLSGCKICFHPFSIPEGRVTLCILTMLDNVLLKGGFPLGEEAPFRGGYLNWKKI